MNYATIKKHDVANGPGVRVSLFVSGCTHACKGCFNREAWDFSYGDPFTPEVEEEIIRALAPSYIAGFSLLGGEPLDPANQEAVLRITEKVKQLYPNKTVWCYTGYDFESDLLAQKVGNWDTVRRLLSHIDVLVDGPFIEDKKDLRLRFRGSSNQRIILVKESLESDEIELWDDYVADWKE